MIGRAILKQKQNKQKIHHNTSEYSQESHDNKLNLINVTQKTKAIIRNEM